MLFYGRLKRGLPEDLKLLEQKLRCPSTRVDWGSKRSKNGMLPSF